MARIQLRNAAEPPVTPFERGYNIILDDYPGDPVPIFPDGITLYAADSAGDGTSSPYILLEDGTVLDLAAMGGGGGGTVTTVSVVTNQGVSGSVATATTTPAITLTLGALTGVTSINGLVITANTGTITTGIWNGTAIGAAYLDLSGTQPLDSDLTAIAALTTDAFGRGLLTQTSAADVRTYIGAGTGSGDALVANPLSQFAATTSLQLKGVISDETGSGALVFADTPTLIAPILGTPTSGNLANCTFPTLNQNTSGNAATATALQTARNIGGVSFNGTADITVATATGGFTISGGNLALGANSITMTGSIGITAARVAKGWFTDLEVTNVIVGSITGSAPTLTTSRNINGVAFNGSGDITVTAAAGTLTGTTLNSTVVTSSLTTVGTLVNLTVTNTIVGSVNGNAATATALQNARTIGGVSFNGTANITVSTATAGFTVTGGTLTPVAGTTSLAAVTFPSGSLTTAGNIAAGQMSYDGVNLYGVLDTTSAWGAIPVEQYFHLTADGGAITTIANFFGATSNISLVANAYYEIEIMLVFLKTTTEIPNVVLTNSAAPTSQNIRWEQSPIVGVTAPPGSNTGRMGFTVKDTTQALTIGAGSLTTAVNHYIKINIQLQNGTGTSLKIQMSNPAGSVTPRLGSYWRCRRMSPNNIGAFAS